MGLRGLGSGFRRLRLGLGLGLHRVMRLQIGVLGATDERRDRRRRLGTVLQPVVDALEIELEVGILDLGVIPPEDLEELAVTGRTRVRRDDTIGRMVGATRTTHSELNHCLSTPFR